MESAQGTAVSNAIYKVNIADKSFTGPNIILFEKHACARLPEKFF
jgi:hypothetical protein